jgi:predicted metal-dependent hydrolase
VTRALCLRPSVPGGERIFQRIYTRLGCSGRPPRFIVHYHPYVDLTHTIRVREDTAYVRLSDILENAPLLIVEAAAAILLSRLYRRRPPAELLEAYRQFSYARSTRQRMSQLRRARARKLKHHPQGRHYHLEPLFDRLNDLYFKGELRRPKLVWSKRSWRSQLGCFDPALDQIVMNRRLDRPEVPEYVVAYVLYHEMLHVKHPIRVVRCRRQSHSAKFRLEEKQFSDYGRAIRFLELRPNQ